MRLPKQVEQIFTYLVNAIAENVKKKKKRKKKRRKQLWQWDCRNRWRFFFFSLRQVHIICEREKKKIVTYTIFLQHFNNKSHLINYYQLKKFVTTNCGNGIAEIGRKKKFVLNCGKAIAEIGRKKNVLAIVAMALLKMKKKKNCFGNCGNGIVENGK